MGLLNGTGWFIVHPHDVWADIGYHFILDPSNDTDPDTVILYEGRELEGLGLTDGQYTEGSAVKLKNALAGISICVLGNYETATPTWTTSENFSEIRRMKLEKVLTALSFRYKTPLSLPFTYPAATIVSPGISYHQQIASQPPIYETTKCPGSSVISVIPTTANNVQNNLQ